MSITGSAGLRRVQQYIVNLEEPASWDGRTLAAARSSWQTNLDREQANRVDNSIERAVHQLGHWNDGASVEAWKSATSDLADIVTAASVALEGGAGIALIRNLPVRQAQSDVAFDEDMLWALGALLGRPVNQNGHGQLLAHVRDLGGSRRGRDVRPEDTNEPLKHHTDGSDILLLMCVRQATEGGNSFISSSVRTVQEIAKRHPELLPTLFEEPFPFDRNEEQPEGDDPFYLTRLCTIVDGRISVRYSREMIETAQRAPGAPQLSPSQRRLMDIFDEISAEGGAEVDIRPGDLMVVNNYSVLHARSTFSDVDDIDRRRLLVRLWTQMWSGRPLPFDFDRGVNTDGVGRGGVPLAQDDSTLVGS